VQYEAHFKELIEKGIKTEGKLRKMEYVLINVMI